MSLVKELEHPFFTIYSLNKLKENTFLPGPILIVSSWPDFLTGISGLALCTLFRQCSSLKGFQAYLPSHWLPQTQKRAAKQQVEPDQNSNINKQAAGLLKKYNVKL